MFPTHPAPLDATIPSNGFWNDILVADFQEIMRVDTKLLAGAVISHLTLGVFQINKELLGWQNQVCESENITTIDDLDNPGEYAHKDIYINLYQLAVFNFAYAEILPLVNQSLKKEGKDYDEFTASQPKEQQQYRKTSAFCVEMILGTYQAPTADAVITSELIKPDE